MRSLISLIQRIYKGKSYTLIEISIVFVFSLTPLLWFNKNYIIIGHDSGFRLDNKTYLQQMSSPWQESVNLGQDWSIFRGCITVQAPEFFFSIITGSYYLGQIFTFIFWFFVMGTGMYILLHGLFSEQKYFFIRIIGPLVYTYNFFLLQGWFIGERGKFSVYAMLPVSLLILERILRGKWSIIIGAVIWGIGYGFFNGCGIIPLYGASILLWGNTVVFFGFTLLIQKKWRELPRLILSVVVLIFSFVAFNAFWIIPQVHLALSTFESSVSDQGGIDGLIAWEKEISKNASWINLIRMQGIPDWYTDYHPYSNIFLSHPVFILLSFLPISLICYSLYKKVWKIFNKEQQQICLLVLILFIFSIFFTAGSHPPFGSVYLLFMRYVPGFAIFRSSYYKFAPLLFFCISLLTTFSLYYILKNIHSKISKIIYFCLIIVVWLGFHWPFFTDKFFEFKAPYSTKVSIPEYVFEGAQKLELLVPNNGRVLLLPPPDVAEIGKPIDLYDWGYNSLTFLPRVLTSKRIITSDEPGGIVARVMYKALLLGSNEEVIDFAKRFNITHILFRNDVKTDSQIAEYKKAVEGLDNTVLIYNNKWQIYQLPIHEIRELELYSSIITHDGKLEDAVYLSAIYDDPIVNKIDKQKQFPITLKSISAECYWCKSNEYNSQVQALTLPPRKSVLASIGDKVIRKKLDAPIANENPSQKIDRLLAQILWVVDDSEISNNDEYNTDNTISSIKTAFEQLPPREKVIYANRISVYSDFFRSIVKSDKNDKYVELKKYVQANTWYGSEQEYRYSITIDHAGDYEIVFPFFSKEKSIFINNKRISNRVYLEQGFHLFSINRSLDDTSIPIVYFQNNIDSTNNSEQQFMFVQNSPTEYSVSVKLQQSKLLVFKQHFDNRWYATQSNAIHIPVNGVLNGWFIPKGTYEFKIMYNTSEKYRQGNIISSISYAVGIIILIVIKRASYK